MASDRAIAPMVEARAEWAMRVTVFVDLPQALGIFLCFTRVETKVVVRGGSLGVLDAVGDGHLGVYVLLVAGGYLHQGSCGRG